MKVVFNNLKVHCHLPRARRRLAALALTLTCVLGAWGCDSDAAKPGDDPGSTGEPLYVTSTIVLRDDGENTYVSALPTLDAQEVSLRQAREFAGWSGIWTNDGKLYVSDGEAPTMKRYSVADSGSFQEEGEVSFLKYGEYADSVFVSSDKAYVFGEEVAVWNPKRLEIEGSFAVPDIANRDNGLEYSGLLSGREVVVRGNRLYAATHWANWDEYDVSEDSLIVVIDTEKDAIIDTIPVDCPYLDSATIADDGTVYFSNWVYTLAPTLLHGKRKACAVRILPGEDRVDDSWSLTFADVTEGREGAALNYLGDNKALISVFHAEEIDLNSDEASFEELADSAHWRFWTVDLESLEASPVSELGPHAGGFATAHVDGHSFVMMPQSNYEATDVYELSGDGHAELRWTTPGWSTQLLKLR